MPLGLTVGRSLLQAERSGSESRRGYCPYLTSLLAEDSPDMGLVLGFRARYLGDAKKLPKMLAKGFDADIRKELMQPLAAFGTTPAP